MCRAVHASVNFHTALQQKHATKCNAAPSPTQPTQLTCLPCCSTGLVTEAAYPYHAGSCAYTTRTNTTFCFNNTCPTTLCRTCAADRVAAAAPKVKLAGDGFIPVAAGSKEALIQVCCFVVLCLCIAT